MATKMNLKLAHITDWIFDLDNTLYRADANFFKQIDVKMTKFIARYLSLESEAASLKTFEIFNKVFNVDPARAIFFEDNVFNLEVPKSMGMVTVLVTSDADFSDAPEVVRPSGQSTTAHWVDFTTNDLPKWLASHSAALTSS